MDKRAKELIEKLEKKHSLSSEEYLYIIENRDEESAQFISEKADKIRKEIYGNTVFIRGLIEISNICKNDCYYCGIRKSNKNCERYRLSKEDIIACTDTGYPLGFRSFVLQGGEDPHFTDEVLTDIIKEIKNRHPDCAVTLSLGERSRESYENLKKAGADRYLLRHETADKDHYSRLHPRQMKYETRMECLENLRQAGFQVGCGFMVGSPYQKNTDIVKDLMFIEKFKPDMCGIGPFITHKDTPFASFENGSAELTCFLLSVIRLIHPFVLLPSTTALGTISSDGREKGILAGANVVMPNLSPDGAKEKYTLYNNKIFSGAESAFGLTDLKKRFEKIGYEIVTDRGDVKKQTN